MSLSAAHRTHDALCEHGELVEGIPARDSTPSTGTRPHGAPSLSDLTNVFIRASRRFQHPRSKQPGCHQFEGTPTKRGGNYGGISRELFAYMFAYQYVRVIIQ